MQEPQAVKDPKIGEEPEADKDRPEIKVVDRRPFTNDGRRREQAPPTKAGEGEPEAAGPADRVEGSGFTMADDPEGTDARADRNAAFVNLCVSLFESGCIHLGMGEHPAGSEAKIDLDAARGAIAMLQMLKRKTSGNLTSEEAKILDSLLADLQMTYVMKAPAASS